jgi:AbrB family looped-hinge helix DNA binding protein
MSVVKIGISRQVVVPRKVFNEVGLAPGDYLQVVANNGSVVMKPMALVDKNLPQATLSREGARRSGEEDKCP